MSFAPRIFPDDSTLVASDPSYFDGTEQGPPSVDRTGEKLILVANFAVALLSHLVLGATGSNREQQEASAEGAVRVR